jgi:hemerythrin
MTTPPAPRLRWSDAFLLGHAPMDRMHREFVEIVDAMLGCDDADFAAHLAAFIVHAQAHFGDEDRAMAESNFPAMACHVDEHAAVLQSARDVNARVLAGDIGIGRELAAELARWFPSHADHLDSAVAHWLVKQRSGGAPVVLRRNVAHAA